MWMSKLAIAIALLFSHSLYAEDNVATEPLKAIGSWSMLSQFKDYEKPFWTELLPKQSQGRIQRSETLLTRQRSHQKGLQTAHEGGFLRLRKENR